MNTIEKSFFFRLFINSGYVLDFSTADFNNFTTSSIGVPLCEKYQLSKGKSLMAYCNEASDSAILKLFTDLLEYYEEHCWRSSVDKQELYEKCRAIIENKKENVGLSVPSVEEVNRDYIIDISSRAIRDVENGEYDSAITKARTLLEEVFCHVIEQKGEKPSESGDIGKLYGQVKGLYKMHQDKELDKRVNALLSGLEKILSALAEMRNANSDAHGVGMRRIAISEHHARLFVNSAMTMADFILSVEKNANS